MSYHRSTRRSMTRLVLAVAALLAPTSLHAEETPTDDAVPQITVWGERSDGFEHITVDDSAIREAGADASSMLRSLPGADFNANGPISGQVQYRGMSSVRMNVVVDGMHVDPGGPNWMDPPLHYLPQPLIGEMELQRGIASVSSGAETLGGTLTARSKSSRFSNADRFEVHGDLSVSGRTVDDSILSGAMVSLANRQHRLHAFGTIEKGDDYEFDDGDVVPTEFERRTYGGGYGVRLGAHEFGFSYRHQRTDDSGTPALPMDIAFFDSDFWSVEYSASAGELDWSGRLFWSEIDHRMDNFNRRPAPGNPAAARFATAESDSFGYELEGEYPLASGALTLGTDARFVDHDMDVFNPNNATFFVNGFNNVERDRYGVFAEWSGDLVPAWSLELGVRYNRVKTDAGRVDLAPGLPPPAQLLKNSFNSADREETDGNVDWVAKLNYRFTPELTLQLGAARKTRSPYYVERYAWLPIEATAGLADGNNHVGDIGLDPEVSHEVELGLDWRSRRLLVSPRVFYRRVDDYIQGTPVDATPGVIDSPLEMVSSLNGDATPLRYTNVDAKLYGFDLMWGLVVSSGLRLDGTLTLVRGRRRDTTDDLYRVSPFSGNVALTYERDHWSLTLESLFADDQDDVSRANAEPETSGWTIFSLTGNVEPLEGLTVSAGVHNIFDKRYRDHLGGVNRVTNADLPLGRRIPGNGRSLFANLNYAF